MQCVYRCSFLFPFLLIVFCNQESGADDWLQWGGANRNFQINPSDIPEKIQLNEQWRRPLGEGYTAILVDAGRLYTMYRTGDDETIVCLDQASGETIWEQSYAARLGEEADASFGKGPNATQLIDGDSIVSIGFNGDLHCHDKQTGELRWKTNLIADLGGTRVDLGYSPSPIMYDGNVILPVGGKGKGIVALRLKDGSVAWSAQDFDNSYATPVLARVGAADQLIFVMTDEVISVNPSNGELFWSFPLTNQWSTHAFVPVWDPTTNMLFVSSFRQSHGLLLKQDGDQPSFEKKWSIERSGVGFTNAVIINGVVYGCTGGSRTPFITAIDLSSGEIRFKERGFSVSNFLAFGDRILLLDESGKLAIARPSDTGLNVIDETQVLSAPKAWTVPTMVGNRVYLRDQKEIVVYEIVSAQ